jgi:hypothetical protein
MIMELHKLEQFVMSEGSMGATCSTNGKDENPNQILV